MVIGYVELNAHTSSTKHGKKITRYDAIVQNGNSNLSPNVNIGITPKGTRYYRATLPDKSWSSLYMKRANGDEVIIDAVAMGDKKQAKAELRAPNRIIKSDRLVNHVKLDTTSINTVAKDLSVGKVSFAYVQDDAKLAVDVLDKKKNELLSKGKGIISRIAKIIK